MGEEEELFGDENGDVGGGRRREKGQGRGVCFGRMLRRAFCTLICVTIYSGYLFVSLNSLWHCGYRTV